ncbi:MAG: ATP-binding domain-containing protein [Aestuariibacter sp.]
MDTNDKILINESVLDCMELGYAITLHKAQGSQLLRIIIALQTSSILDRTWPYSAITRAEMEVHIVGSRTDFVSVTKNASNANQKMSYLSELLRKKQILQIKNALKCPKKINCQIFHLKKILRSLTNFRGYPQVIFY